MRSYREDRDNSINFQSLISDRIDDILEYPRKIAIIKGQSML